MPKHKDPKQTDKESIKEIHALFKVKTESLRKEIKEIDSLIKQLDNENWEKRHEACLELGNRKAPKAVLKLTELIFCDKEPAVRSIAAKALGKIGIGSTIFGGKQVDVIKDLADVMLYDGDIDVQAVAAESLIKIKNKRAAPFLRKALKEGPDDVKDVIRELWKK